MTHHSPNRTALPLLLIMAGSVLWAQIPNGYYNDATNKTGNELKIALHDIIKGHHVVSYGGLLNAFAYTDCKPNGKIWDIYSNIEYSPSTGVCGEYEQEGDCWNREHTWPQSWFNESTTPRSDLFHIYPTDGFVNAQRSNYPYGEVSHPTYTSGNGSKLGPCTTAGYTGKVFEPIDEYKGDIARSYFYMSVRYYSEDDDWGASDMTNKSVIRDWAMNMLLRWSDEDPVSQKEIDRNNAVYGFQSNRNPFIDHPEYARMIWDPNWSQGESYNITCATGLLHGSLSAPESALEGSTVIITAIPDPGYMVDSWNVFKTDEPDIQVNVSSNGTFTMPSFDVTVSATFVQNDTYYTLTQGTVSHGSISISATTALSGTNITLTATPDNGYALYSWYVFKTGDMSTIVPVTGSTFVMPAFNVTVMATFTQNIEYVKVTTPPTDWSGEYLIVYESGSKAFNGALTTLDATGNTISVSISNHRIVANETTNAAMFTIAAMDGGYSIKSASGKYIGRASYSNGIDEGYAPQVNTLSMENGNTLITGSGGCRLQFNAAAGQERFRYFKSSQQPVQLYKKNGTATTPTHNINFNPNGGTGSMDVQTVNEFEATALHPNTFTNDGYAFDSWNTETDGSGDYYVDGASVTLLTDLELYAQWNPLYTITCNPVMHGSINANVDAAIAETTITLTAFPDNCYYLDHWTVTDAYNNPITVTENQFEMPACHVTVSATFCYSTEAFEQHYYLVTSVDQLVVGRTYLIVNADNGKALGTTQNNNNRSAAPVTIEDDVITTIDNTVCELTLGGQSGAWTFFDPNWSSNGGYLYAASSSNNQLKTQASPSDNAKWSISIGTDGNAIVAAQGNNSHNLLRYNQGSDIFSCYLSGQLDVCLFRRSELEDYTFEQTDELYEGWNWWSTQIQGEGSDLLEQLKQTLGSNGMKIVSQNDGYTVYVPQRDVWYGPLNAIHPGEMYKIQTSSVCTININGIFALPDETPISLNPGYNWIGFLGTEELEINAALVHLTPTNSDIIRSNNYYAVYIPGRGWAGTLTTLKPGQGYNYYSKATEVKTFTFPSGSGK